MGRAEPAAALAAPGLRDHRALRGELPLRQMAFAGNALDGRLAGGGVFPESIAQEWHNACMEEYE